MKRAALLVFCLLTCGAAAAGPAATRLVAGSPSRLVLNGSSNVTDWRCSGTTIAARVDIGAPIEKINEVIDRIEDGNIGVFMANPEAGRFPAPELELDVPVATIRCGNAVMERDMARALRADEHPSIRFKFRELRGPVEHDIDRNTYSAKIAGELSLAGVTRTIELNAVAERIARDRFRLRAELPLRMTDFGVQPPTALFGMVKAKNELVVRFDLIVRAS